ncbi:hypothetical protein [Rubellicoccus peritrichatus]|uniref:Uncharacterized protein n=1 Tax=Rubellicoccus peritrichatus TaxID=3080537 RepID=A0AAQ3L7A0_9BACT|nr:hypothetical protein [Puniceicoccus sp. CR14]WOO39942.1 hypothetical protein RZN69_15050 [Puniceicoccus sp. CR14]
MKIIDNRKENRGSALAAVIMIAAVIGLIVASIFEGTVTEMKVNDRYVTRIKAKTAAETAIEYGASDLSSRFERRSSFPTDELKTGKNPLTMPDTMGSFYGGTDIMWQKMAINGGVVPPGEWVYFDPTDPANEFDPMRGRRAYVREIVLLGKGAAKAANGDEINAFATELFQVRDAPLFANAIFYNADLEINPGVNMDIYGPVHTNGDLYVGAKSVANLRFHDKVTTTGDVIHGEKKPVHISDGSNVWFPSSTNPEILRNMRDGNSILDSSDANFPEDASERWNGYLQDGEMGVGPQNVVAFDDYVADDYATAANEKTNSGYALIEPLLPTNHADRKSDSLREQKMAYKAGLVLKVVSDPNRSHGHDEYYTVKAYKYSRTNADNPLSNPVLDADGNLTLTEVTLPPNIVGDPESDFLSVGDNVIEQYEDDDDYWWKPTEGGLYDNRENRGVATFGLDVGKLKQYIDAKDNTATGFDGTYDVDKEWNGIVYVEFPTSSTRDSTSGEFDYGTSSGKNTYNIVPAVIDTDSEGESMELALMVLNGKEIPDPSGMEQPGFTLATNAPMYTVGSFNANGVFHTNDATAPDDNDEKPAALIADTITVLSDEWDGNRRYSYLDGRSYLDDYRDVSGGIEISAALVSGTPNTVPSGAAHTGGASSSRPLSLGVVNLPRFLEYWTSETLTIRGSMVSLYESEVRPLGAPTNFNDYYTPPIRDWGFSDLFKAGNYPPGTPLVRTYRRLMYEEMEETSYNTAMTNLH